MIIGTIKAALIFLLHAFAYGVSLGMGFWLAGKVHQRIDHYYLGLWRYGEKEQFWKEIVTDPIMGSFFKQIQPYFHKEVKKEEKTVDIPA